MRKPLIPSLLLALIFLGSACDNAKFTGKGKNKDKKNSELIVDPPAECQPGETCVTDPNPCTPGTPGCATVDPPTTTNPPPPGDECKDGDKDCPVVPPTDCDDEPGQNPGQNDGKGKKCPKDEPGQNPGKGKDCDHDHDHDDDCDDRPHQNDPVQNK